MTVILPRPKCVKNLLVWLLHQPMHEGNVSLKCQAADRGNIQFSLGITVKSVLSFSGSAHSLSLFKMCDVYGAL